MTELLAELRNTDLLAACYLVEALGGRNR